MIEEFQDIKDEHTNLFQYSDDLSQDSIEGILTLVENIISRHHLKKSLHRKVFYVVVECIQNVYNHNADPTEGDPMPKIEFGLQDSSYYIITSNLISNEDIPYICKKIDSVNGMSQEELKNVYKEVLNNNIISKKGGAGLGLIDIARKSQNKIEYKLKPHNSNKSFLYFKASITNKEIDIKETTESVNSYNNMNLSFDPSIKGTKHTPTIAINNNKRLVKIYGKSLPTDATKFYSPLMQWLNDYAFINSNDLKVVFHLEYFNTPSSFKISDLFSILEKQVQAGKSINIEWLYDEEDIDMLESGQEFSNIFNIPFVFNEVPEE